MRNGPGIGWLMSAPGPKPFFAPPGEGEEAAAAEVAAAAAAAKAVADAKAAADAAAAKVVADKAAADAAAKAAADDIETKRKAGELSDREAELLKETMARKAKIKDLEDQLAVAAALAAKFEGVDADEARKLAAAAAEATKAKLKAEGDFDALRTMMADEHKKEIEAERKRNADASTALSAAMVQINELTVGQSFATSPFVNDETVLTPAKARIVYGPNFSVENGVVVAYDKPAGTEGRVKLVDSSGNAMPFEAAIKHMIDKDPDRDRMLASKVKSGAGSKTTDGKGKPAAGGTGRERIEGGLGTLLSRHIKT